MPTRKVTAQRTLHPARFVSLAALAVLVASGCAPSSGEPEVVRNAAGDPLVSTFSIVAVDTTTGEIGVAVQSKFPNVRFMVPTVVAGVGAVATQSFARLAYGPEGIALMRQGATAQEALRVSMRNDPDTGARQVGMVDARGNAATFTGADAFAWRGGRVGGSDAVAAPGVVAVGHGYAAQGNILVSQATVDAIAETFEASTGTLALRLTEALLAGGRAGGDKRGEQSAALVVHRKGAGYDGSDVIVDISVYDHLTPLAELARLVALNDLYFTDSDPADMIEVTPAIARELQEIWIARSFQYDGPADGVVDAEFQRILTDYMGWENYDLRIDEVADVDLGAGETLRIDREVLADIRAVFSEGRYR
ncbi:DUF1028 domain-containing protein [Rubrivirga sp. IMCC45206]|uniref:DUF1028 domain-containing protein n=1 Tax=Rubrivirga sp. IMCC45206 TaxID=3391614 RepID=UPI00398FCED9